MRIPFASFAALALVALLAPTAAAEELLAACAESDLLTPAGIPEGEQGTTLDSAKLLGGIASVHLEVAAKEGKRGLNAVNVKKA